MSNVTFEPGCRNNWHSHTGGQRTNYRERRHASVLCLEQFQPHHREVNGAPLYHVPDNKTNQNTWLERVDDQQYAEVTKDNVAIGLQATDPDCPSKGRRTPRASNISLVMPIKSLTLAMPA